MTNREFDAPASTTPRVQHRPSPHTRIAIRCAWLIARLATHRPVRFAIYHERFERSLRTFRRDLAILRDAGIYLNTADGDVAWVCFRAEAAAA